jgi:hypothetical protein
MYFQAQISLKVTQKVETRCNKNNTNNIVVLTSLILFIHIWGVVDQNFGVNITKKQLTKKVPVLKVSVSKKTKTLRSRVWHVGNNTALRLLVWDLCTWHTIFNVLQDSVPASSRAAWTSFVQMYATGSFKTSAHCRFHEIIWRYCEQVIILVMARKIYS